MEFDSVALNWTNHRSIFRIDQMPQDRRTKRDLHALTADGMVLCNPRDKEAAHRAEMEGIATEDRQRVTCTKCLMLLHQRDREERDSVV